MLEDYLVYCNNLLPQYECCKADDSPCDCVSSLKADFNDRPDTYDCKKKMCTYVLRYGLAYISEIYQYLEYSDFKRKLNNLNRPLVVKSLGCGFSPDYFALKEYFSHYNIDLPIDYTGLDNSSSWDDVRSRDCSFQVCDLTKPFDLSGTDIVFISKVFSTLHRNEKGEVFLKELEQAITGTLKGDSLVIFIDINNQCMGRDIFHNSVRSYLPEHDQYYFEGGYTGYNWKEIPQQELIIDIPHNLSIDPLNGTGQTIIFEYRK